MGKGEKKSPKKNSKKDRQADKKISLTVRKVKTISQKSFKSENSPQIKPEPKEEASSDAGNKLFGQGRKKLFFKKRKSSAASLLPKEMISKPLKPENQRLDGKHEFKKPPKQKLSEIDYEKIEKDKRLIMVTGVSFFMILISFFWLYGARQIFQSNNPAGSEASLPDWEELTGQIGKSIAEMQAGMEEIKNFAATGTEETAGTGAKASLKTGRLPESQGGEAATGSRIMLSDKDIDSLKNKLEEKNAGN